MRNTIENLELINTKDAHSIVTTLETKIKRLEAKVETLEIKLKVDELRIKELESVSNRNDLIFRRS